MSSVAWEPDIQTSMKRESIRQTSEMLNQRTASLSQQVILASLKQASKLIVSQEAWCKRAGLKQAKKLEARKLQASKLQASKLQASKLQASKLLNNKALLISSLKPHSFYP